MRKLSFCLFLAIFCLTNLASRSQAQFTSDFLQNGSYWNDGKAEFDLYDAQIVRYGQPRPTEGAGR